MAGNGKRQKELLRETGGVAPDFNNLLMIISGNLYTIKKEITILASAEERDVWLRGSLKRLGFFPRRLPDDALKIVMRGADKEDNAAA
jgi:hypothetical protein